MQSLDMTPGDDGDAVAIIGVGACLPDAPNVPTYWQNIINNRVAIGEVPKERWSPELYYRNDRKALRYSYSKIGGFVRYDPFDPKRFRIVPRSLPAIDQVQKLALVACAEALTHAQLKVFAHDATGREFSRERCAIILGNSMGGEAEDLTSLRVWLNGIEDAMAASAKKAGISASQCQSLLSYFQQGFAASLPLVTEDSMPGELSNCITGRIANVFDLCGPNFTTDAACASSHAALQAGVRSLLRKETDLAIVGGADRSMDPPTYVKFSRIGALSANMSAPFDARADGFVMGEGVGVLVLRRLSDALSHKDNILAIVRGIGGSSDGRGKGITAPNPRGQRLAISRAWHNARASVVEAGLFEAHGTSTPIGDQTELAVLTELLEEGGASGAPVAVGSVKSMIGHLKAAAGAASLIKGVMALSQKTLPPSANFVAAPKDSPLLKNRLAVNTTTRAWPDMGAPRLMGISSFGFGGTNFHVVLQEAPNALAAGARHRPHAIKTPPAALGARTQQVALNATPAAPPTPRVSTQAVADTVIEVFANQTGYDKKELELDHKLEADLGIDSVKQAEILALLRDTFRVAKDAPLKLAELSTLRHVIEQLGAFAEGLDIGNAEPSAPTSHNAAALERRDKTAHTTKPTILPQLVAFACETQHDAVEQGLKTLRDAGDTSSALLGFAPTPKLASAAWRISFVASNMEDAQQKLLDAKTKNARVLAARGTFVATQEPLATRGDLAFVFPGQGSQYLGMLQTLAAHYPTVAQTFAEADAILQPLLNKTLTSIVWTDDRSENAEAQLRDTAVCQPAMLCADVAMYRLLVEHGIRPKRVAGHSLGEYAAAVAAEVLSFADALYAVSARGREMAGVRVDDPGKMAMVAAEASRVEDVLANVDGYVIAANKNCHTQTVIAGASRAVDAALKAFAGLNIEARQIPVSHAFHSQIVAPAAEPLGRVFANLNINPPVLPLSANVDATYYPSDKTKIIDVMTRQLASPVQFIDQVERLWADGVRIFVEVGPKRAITGFVRNILGDKEHRALASNHPKKDDRFGFLELLAALAVDGIVPRAPDARPNPEVGTQTHKAAQLQATSATPGPSHTLSAAMRPRWQSHAIHDDNLVITGAAVALPRQNPLTGVFESPGDDSFHSLLTGENFIGSLDKEARRRIVDRKPNRFDKNRGEFLQKVDDDSVIHLAAQLGPIDLSSYGLDANVEQALDQVGRLTVACGLDALRDAGLPLVQRLRTTTTGSTLIDRWALPKQVARRTGVILASAFPGLDAVLSAVDDEMQAAEDYAFDRRWIFRALAMGHAQLAQVVLAQGPNTQINAACASGTQAMAMAQDWLRLGRCDRVIVVSADNVTSQATLPWMGAAFLAAGAATIERDLKKAAVPFGAGRNGLILGAGASAFVVEKRADADARGIMPIAELIDVQCANSGYHGTRLDADFICEFFEDAMARVQHKLGLSRQELASRALFVSHETFTPARGGSAAAEILALRHAFGADVTKVLIANSKGFTGHPMGASLEDAVAVKALQRAIVAPIAHAYEIDKEFEGLNFAQGGPHDKDVSFRFAAGFGSQMALASYRQVARQEARLSDADVYHRWLESQGVPQGSGLEVHGRVLRVAATGGKRIDQLGIASLMVLGRHVHVDGDPPHEALLAASKTLDAEDASDDVLSSLSAMFAEQTGYDVADLHPEHALEADLGIDSVKQAEIMVQIRQRYNLGADPDFKIGEVQTLAALAAYVANQQQPSEPSATSAASTPAPPAALEDSTTAHAASPPKNIDGSSETTDPSIGAKEIDAQPVLKKLVALFAQQTGYEEKDLHPDHHLEADLGIDSVKQAEILAVVRQDFGLKDFVVKLADVPTLKHMAAHIAEASQSIVPQQDDISAAKAGPNASADSDAPTGAADAFVPKRVVLVPVVPPHIDPQQPWPGEVVVLGDDDDAGQTIVRHLLEQGAQARVVPLNAAQTLVQTGKSEGAHSWVYVAPDVSNHEEALNAVQALFLALHQWRRQPPHALYVVGRGGMAFGAMGDQGVGHAAQAVAMAGQSGFIKALVKEWPEVRVEILDVNCDTKGARVAWSVVAKVLAQAMRADQGETERAVVVEADDKVLDARWLSLARATTPAEIVHEPLPQRAVVVATGGARGVTFELLLALVKKRPLNVYILARTDMVDPKESPVYGKTPEVQRDVARQALRKSRAKDTPAAIRQWLLRQQAQIDTWHNVQALKACGAQVVLLPCDVSSKASLSEAVANIKKQNAGVALLLHGAGVEESKFFVDKSADSFARTASPKAVALVALCQALEPKRVVTMGSVAGRFGNAGQTDYAAANEMMAGMARLVGSQMLNICWTAWADIGMATRGSVRQVLESGGVHLLPGALGTKLGASLIESTLVGDVVVAGPLGSMATTEPKSPVPFIEQTPCVIDTLEQKERGDGHRLRVMLDPKKALGLNDHRIDGVIVVPGVVGVEMMVRAARHVMGRAPVALCDVEFTQPIKLFDDAPMSLDVEAMRYKDRVHLKVVSDFVGPGKRHMRREHFCATASFVASDAQRPQHLTEPMTLLGVAAPVVKGPASQAIYKRYFHGPAFQVLGDLAVQSDTGMDIDVVSTDANTSLSWLYGLDGNDGTTQMRAREAGFQAAGLFEMQNLKRMSLPKRIVKLWCAPLGAIVKTQVRCTQQSVDGAVFDVVGLTKDGTVIDAMLGFETTVLRQLSSDQHFGSEVGPSRSPALIDMTLQQARKSERLVLPLGPLAALITPAMAPVRALWLNASEQKRFDGLGVDKRRLEWLAGRLVAKHMVLALFPELPRVPALISVVADALGAPSIAVDTEAVKALAPRYPSIDDIVWPALSISHGAGFVAVICARAQGTQVGIDVEEIKARDPSFAGHFFTDVEQTHLGDAKKAAPWVTAMWSVKEAVLKALGVGNRMDFRLLQTEPPGPEGFRRHAPPSQGVWRVRLSGAAKERLVTLGVGFDRNDDRGLLAPRGKKHTDLGVDVEVGTDRVVAFVVLPAQALAPHRLSDPTKKQSGVIERHLATN